MDWVSVKDRKPDCDMPVLMYEPANGWHDGGVMLLGIYKGGEFQADRPQYVVRPSHWIGPVMPPE